jgi:uncharacterized membrane protein
LFWTESIDIICITIPQECCCLCCWVYDQWPSNEKTLGLGLWCLMPISIIFHFIMVVSFIGGGNRSTRRKLLTSQWQTIT